MARKSKPLVVEHLENISRKALEKYQPFIREYVKGKKGVYALYRGDRLKYVGLATNLRGRLHTHLRDRHSHSWDKFSVYLTVDDEHLRELEALVIRIAAPRENRQKSKFAKSENLGKRFRQYINAFHKKEIAVIFGDGKGDLQEHKDEKQGRPSKTRSSGKAKQPALAPYINKAIKIRADYKGKHYTAKLWKNGLIKYNRKLFTSPAFAGMAITKKVRLNGWRFWKFRNEKGEWVWLEELRKRKGLGRP